MSTWVIGDVHGQAGALEALLTAIDYQPSDRLIFVGDLVNRGPDSHAVLRQAYRFGAEVVLGNHDVHLLARVAGLRKSNPDDSFSDVLAAPDRDELLDWLTGRPLAIAIETVDPPVLVVHAGLLPQWSIADARSLAEDVGARLASGGLEQLLNKENARNHSSHPATAFAALTRLRTCKADGRMNRRFTGPPADAPKDCLAWFDHPARWRDRGWRVVFGHWAALGLNDRNGACCLDSGAAWGGRLSALRLEDWQLVSVDIQTRTTPSDSRDATMGP